MSDNITEVLGQINTAVTELRVTDIANLKSADVLNNEKMDRINAAIDGLKSQVTDLETKAARPSMSTEDTAVSEYKSAWATWARKGDGETELKSITLNNTDGTPGVLAPRVVEDGIYAKLQTLSPIRNEATVIQVSGDEYRFLAADGDFATGWVGETDARPETATSTIGEVRTPMGEIYANPHASQRALDDAQFNLDGYMIDQTSRAFAKAENAAFVNGNGVNKPQGILSTAGLNTVNSGVAAKLPANADAYISMIFALDAAYREGAKFYMASAGQASVRTIKDTNGNYQWQNSLIAGQPDTLAGYSVVTIEDMDPVAAGKMPVIFGNMKLAYLIVDRFGIRTLRDPYSKKPYVGFYSTKRVGGLVKDKGALVVMKIGV